MRAHRALLVVCAVAAGCTSSGTNAPAPASYAPPQAEVYFYPARGQSPAQQDRDRYDCYLWAVGQTGFDPSLVQLAPSQRVVVEPGVPPGAGVAAGAVVGAAIGAAIGAPHDEAEGAVVGAIAGGTLGAAAESAETARVQRVYEARAADLEARLESQALSYRRAMAACLEGRGYTVR